MSDERASNTETRVLSQEQSMQLKEFSNLTQDFIALCNKIGRSRELSLAITNAQQAFMWAKEHITPQP